MNVVLETLRGSSVAFWIVATILIFSAVIPAIRVVFLEFLPDRVAYRKEYERLTIRKLELELAELEGRGATARGARRDGDDEPTVTAMSSDAASDLDVSEEIETDTPRSVNALKQHLDKFFVASLSNFIIRALPGTMGASGVFGIVLFMGLFDVVFRSDWEGLDTYMSLSWPFLFIAVWVGSVSAMLRIRRHNHRVLFGCALGSLILLLFRFLGFFV